MATTKTTNAKTKKEPKIIKKIDNLAASLFDQKGEKLKSVKLPEEIFGLKTNPELVALAVRVYLSNQKQKTASTKTRAEVSGGGRKPHRQKGTGRARAGSTRSGGRVGGGVIFGPKPFEKELKLPRKMKLKALATALSDKLRDEDIFLLDKISFKEPSTKKANDMVNKIIKTKNKALLVLSESKIEILKSFRNLDKVDLAQAVDLNALDVVKFSGLIVTLDALENLKKRFGGNHE